MGAEIEIASVLEAKYMGSKEKSVCEVTKSHSTSGFDQLRPPDLVSIDLSDSELSNKAEEEVEFVPCIRSGSFEDIGARRNMEDEHILIDDLSSQLGSNFQFPHPSAFYGVLDGHGGPEAASFVKKNAMSLFFEASIWSEDVEDSLRKGFQRADLALSRDTTVSPSSGTTALTALILGSLLTVANAGDCRAVLCRKGEAVDMSEDHKPVNPPERRRVEELGGFVEDGYLNGVLSVSRALGDWDMKLPRGGSPSPLVSEPQFRRTVLTEDDEFLIMACDGVWDVMSSQQAVSLVRRGLRRHDDPSHSARDLVSEALRLGTFDNLTVLVVCFSPPDHRQVSPPDRLRCCSLSAEALCSLRSLLERGDNGR